MIEVPLTRGKVALIDDEDYPKIAGKKWRAVHQGHTWYARHTWYTPSGLHSVYMHRLVLETEDGQVVDHVSGDGLDNRRANLRSRTHQQNLRNQGKMVIRPGNPYKGASRHAVTGRWRAQITVDAKARHLGYFATAEEAALAYNKAAKELFGEDARLNVIRVGR